MKIALVTLGFWAVLLLPQLGSAVDPIPSGATSSTVQGKIVRLDPDRIEVNTDGSKDNLLIYFDRNTQVNGSTRNTIDRVLGSVFGETHDLKVGDQVTATVTRSQERLVAQSITTQGSSTGSSTPPVASGRACVRDERASQQGQIVCGEVVR
jgi:hypothetical protein